MSDVVEMGKEVMNYTFHKICKLDGVSSRSRQILASLRRGVGREPDAFPELWGMIFDESSGLFDMYSNKVSDEEKAVYLALTLFATHVSGKGVRNVNQSGMTLGKALRVLSGSKGDTVQSYFNRLLTSKSFSELSQHLRRLVAIFRQNGIALDYSKLASDVYFWQKGGAYRKNVLREWNRAFFGIEPKKKEDENKSNNKESGGEMK